MTRLFAAPKVLDNHNYLGRSYLPSEHEMELNKCFILLFIWTPFILCASPDITPGTFGFSGPQAFMELDTQALACSNLSQSVFSLDFDIFIKSNVSVIMAGVSGRYEAPAAAMSPDEVPRQRPHNPIKDNRGYDGDPLALVLYLEKPYIRLVIFRLTDLSIRLYLHHALGFYDRPWYGWHRVSIRTGYQSRLINYRTRTVPIQTEIVFKFDHKEARRQLRLEDVLWPLWAGLRKQAVMETYMFEASDLAELTQSVLLNELFYGLPPEESLSRYAVDMLIEKHSEFKEVFEATVYGVFNSVRGKLKEVSSFYPFSGSIKNIMLGSGCRCHGQAFGPRFIQLGSDVRWDWLCDARSIPNSLLQLKTSMTPPPCRSEETSQPCGCSIRLGRPVCLCPTTAKCRKLPDALIWSLSNAEEGFSDSARFVASPKTNLQIVKTMLWRTHDVVEPVQLDAPVPYTISTSADHELIIGRDTGLGENAGVIFSENAEAWKQADSCFTNIFICRYGIVYRFWLFIDPDAIKKVPENCAVKRLILLKQASSPGSSWHFMVTYEALQNRHFAKNESQKQIFVVGARLMAPPNLLWQIDGCSSDEIRLLPGRWTQVTVNWNLTHITMRFDGRICASEPLTTVQKVQQGNLFSPRNTAFVFLGRSALRSVNETLCNVRSPTYVIRDFSFSVLKPSSNTKTAEAYSFIYLQHRVPFDGIMYLQEQIEVLTNSVSRSPSNVTLMNNKIQLPKTFMDNIFFAFTLLPLDRVRSPNGKTLTVLHIPELGFQVTLQRLQGNNWALRLIHAIEDEGCEFVESRFYGPKVCLKVPCHFEIERGPSTNFTVLCQQERMMLISKEMTVSKQDCSQFIGVDIVNESSVSRLKNGSNISVLHCAFNNLLPYSDVSLYLYPKPRLLEFGIIHTGAFPTMECHFTQLEAMISGEINPNALVSTDFCRLSPELSGLSINLLKVGGVETTSNDDDFEQSYSRDQAFPISTEVPQAHPVIHVKDKDTDCIKGCNPSTAALQCFRALEFCHFGVTIAFWMVYIPSSQEEKPPTQQTWRLAELVGLSNSRLTISLVIDWTETTQSGDMDVALMLMAELRMDRSYTPGYTVVNIWKATVSPNQMKEADSKWAFVVVSWSDFGGLEVSINEQLITTGNRTLEHERERTKPPSVLSEGFYIDGLLAGGRWLGHAGEVLIDEFRFIPAERTRLYSIGQNIGFDTEDAKIPMCNIHTCIADVTCREDSERTSRSTKSRLCRCMSPRRFCTEIPPNRNLRKGRRPNGKPSSRPMCTPACLNNGVCRWKLAKRTWKAVCDCSRTFYWGDSCQHEHVGRLPFEDPDESSASDQNTLENLKKAASFAVVDAGSENNIRIIFRIPVNSTEKEVEKHLGSRVRTRRSVTAEPNMSKRKDVLLSFEGEDGTKCALAVFNHQIGYTCYSKLANPQTWVSLVPCSESSSESIDNGMLHILEIDLRHDFFRVRIGHQPFYPPDVHSVACKEPFTDENWLFFRFNDSTVSSLLGHTAELGEIKKQAPGSQLFHKIFMGAWPDGSDEFPGALGGFEKNSDSMILPTFSSSDEKTNGIYQFNSKFNASHRRIKWILMGSLTPVTVLYDDENSPFLEANGLYIIICIVGSLFLVIVLCALVVLICPLRLKARGSRGFSSTKCHWMPRMTLYNKKPLSISSSLLRFDDVHQNLRVTCDDQSARLLPPEKTKEPILPVLTDDQRSKCNTRIVTLGTHPSQLNTNTQLPACYPCKFPVEAADVERFMVTMDGKTVITMSTTSGLSVKLWKMQDGMCRETLTQKLSSVQDNLPDSADFALLERSQYLLAGFGKDVTLWALPCPGTGAKIQFKLKNPVWNIFAYKQVFLIASAPTQSNRSDCFAVLSAWCPDTKAFLYQTDLCIPRDSPLKDLSMVSLQQRTPKLPAVLISPEKSILLFRWTNIPTNFRSGSNTQTRPGLRSIYAAACLDGIQKELQFHTRLMLYSVKQPTIFMHEQPFDVSMTKFLTEHLVLSGSSTGTLNIWDVTSGTVVHTLRNDRISMQNPLLPATIEASLGLTESAPPSITSIAVADPTLAKKYPFNWLCSGDNSGSITVRRYSVAQSQQTGTCSIAARIHGKLRPPFKKAAPQFEREAVTCMCLLDIAGDMAPASRVTLLASGDMVGCIRLWLLPQCTQLAQLSASCEASLVDLALTHSASTNSPTHDFERAVKERWVQVTGLVSAQAMDASQEHGRVVVAHVNANENCSLRQVMYSPKIRQTCK